MSFIVSSLKDIDSIEKFYSLLVEAKGYRESFFDFYFVPDIDYNDFFHYLVTEGILNGHIYNNIIKNIKDCKALKDEDSELIDEEYYLISIGVEPKHIIDNDAEHSYLLYGTKESLKDINTYWYLLSKYLFDNRNVNKQFKKLFNEFCKEALDCLDEGDDIKIEYHQCPNDFNFFKTNFDSEKINNLENILTDCLEITEDDILKGLLKNALALIK